MKDSFPRIGHGGGIVIGPVWEMTDPSVYERLKTAKRWFSDQRNTPTESCPMMHPIASCPTRLHVCMKLTTRPSVYSTRPSARSSAGPAVSVFLSSLSHVLSDLLFLPRITYDDK